MGSGHEEIALHRLVSSASAPHEAMAVHRKAAADGWDELAAFVLGGLELPIVRDAYTELVSASPRAVARAGAVGAVDAAGAVQAEVNLSPGPPAPWSGKTLHTTVLHFDPVNLAPATLTRPLSTGSVGWGRPPGDGRVPASPDGEGPWSRAPSGSMNRYAQSVRSGHEPRGAEVDEPHLRVELCAARAE
jgi:hypothetical protein